MLRVHELLEHLQHAPLVRLRQRHLGFVQQQDRAVRKLRERLAEQRQHDLPVACRHQELVHRGIVLEQGGIVAWIVLFGIKEHHLAQLRAPLVQPIGVVVDGLALQCVVDRVQERGLPGSVLAFQHDQGVGQVHHHRHVKVQVHEDGVAEDLQVHRRNQHSLRQSGKIPEPKYH